MISNKICLYQTRKMMLIEVVELLISNITGKISVLHSFSVNKQVDQHV